MQRLFIAVLFLAPLQAAEPVKVAIYDHSDGSAKAPPNLMRILSEKEGFACLKFKPEDFTPEKLKSYRVVIVPGGSGSLQAKKLGDGGRAAIRQFVKDGGGYVGICAGAYLATTDYDWSLGLLNARVIDRAHWARGTGTVTLDFKPGGKTLLGAKENAVDVYYGQGPLLAPGDKTGDDVPAPYEALATYKTEIAKKGAPSGVMPGTTAIARGEFGKGKVLCYSPHPEVKDGPNELILNGVKWVSEKM